MRATASSETLEAEALRLQRDQAVLDQGLEDLLLETEPAQHGGVEPAALVDPLVELALAEIGPLELADRDRLVAHRGEGLPRGSPWLAPWNAGMYRTMKAAMTSQRKA